VDDGVLIEVVHCSHDAILEFLDVARGRIDLRLLCSSSPGGHVRFDQLRNAVRRRHLAVTYRGLGDMPRSGLFVCGHVSQYAL
jgi:hypothetical protein